MCLCGDFPWRKRASPRGEAGTSGFLCVSDTDRRVPAELGQDVDADIEERLVDTGGEERVEHTGSSIGVCDTMCEAASGEVLRSTGSSACCSVMAWRGRVGTSLEILSSNEPSLFMTHIRLIQEPPNHT